MFGQAPTQKEVANHLRTEFHSLSPRTKMSLISYLANAGYTPDVAESADEYIEVLRGLLEWVGEEQDEFFEMIETLDTEDSAPSLELVDYDPEDDTPTDSDNSGYL